MAYRMRAELHREVSPTLVRLLWMTQWMEHKPLLRLSDVRDRWGVSLRTFRRDLARLRDAGIIIDPAAQTHQGDPAVTKVGWRAWA
jgi:predicted DNA-binding transcriptional regulator YafY